VKLESSGLRDQFLFHFGPCRWRELLDLDNFGCWQAREQILQIINGVEAMPPTTAPSLTQFGWPVLIDKTLAGIGWLNERPRQVCAVHHKPAAEAGWPPGHHPIRFVAV
jgi:hypothetical protein